MLLGGTVAFVRHSVASPFRKLLLRRKAFPDTGTLRQEKLELVAWVPAIKWMTVLHVKALQRTDSACWQKLHRRS